MCSVYGTLSVGGLRVKQRTRWVLRCVLSRALSLRGDRWRGELGVANEIRGARETSFRKAEEIE